MPIGGSILPFDETDAPSWWLASLSSSCLRLCACLDWCLTLRSLGAEGGLSGGSRLCMLAGLDSLARISVIINLDLWGMVVAASPLLPIIRSTGLWPWAMLLLNATLFLASRPFASLSIAPFRLSIVCCCCWWWWWCSRRCASRPDILLRFNPFLASGTVMPLRAAAWWFWWWTVITKGDSGLRAPEGASVATPGLTRYLGDRILPTVLRRLTVAPQVDPQSCSGFLFFFFFRFFPKNLLSSLSNFVEVMIDPQRLPQCRSWNRPIGLMSLGEHFWRMICDQWRKPPNDVLDARRSFPAGSLHFLAWRTDVDTLRGVAPPAAQLRGPRSVPWLIANWPLNIIAAHRSAPAGHFRFPLFLSLSPDYFFRFSLSLSCFSLEDAVRLINFI